MQKDIGDMCVCALPSNETMDIAGGNIPTYGAILSSRLLQRYGAMVGQQGIRCPAGIHAETSKGATGRGF